MEALLASSGWTPIQSDKGQFDLVKKQVALYRVVKDTPAWGDYQHRISQLREGTRLALERGSIDKFGHTHEEEQRAVLYLLDQLLSYFPQQEAEYERLVSVLRNDEAQANRPLYGEDRLTTDVTDLY